MSKKVSSYFNCKFVLLPLIYPNCLECKNFTADESRWYSVISDLFDSQKWHFFSPKQRLENHISLFLHNMYFSLRQIWYWKMLPEVSVCQWAAGPLLWGKLEVFYKLANHRDHMCRDSSLAAACGSMALTAGAVVPSDLGIFWMVNCICLQSEQKMRLLLTSTNLQFTSTKCLNRIT